LIRTHIKHLTFMDSDRPNLTIGANVRAAVETQRAQLKENAQLKYSTAPNLFIITAPAKPGKATQLTGFDVVAIHKKDSDGVTVTSLGFRLHNGTDQFWWDGAAWVVNTTNWNTEAEVDAHIGTFALPADKTFRVVLNLVTTNVSFTPEVEEVRISWIGQWDSYLDDMVHRSLIPGLKQQTVVEFTWPLEMPKAGTTVGLYAAKLESGYKWGKDSPGGLATPQAVYNNTDDPGHATNLFQAWDNATGVLTLTGSVAKGKMLWILVRYEPHVALTTSQDFDEVEKMPLVAIEGVQFVRAARVGQDDYLIHRAAGNGTLLPAPLKGDLEMDLVVSADKQVDAMRLAEAVQSYIGNTPLIRSTGLDEWYRLQLVDEFGQRGSPGQDEVHSWVASIRVVGFLVWDQQARTVPVVTDFHLNTSRVI
jgi:hypothetical protein